MFWLTITSLLAQQVTFHRERRAYDAAREILERPEFKSTLVWSQTSVLNDSLVVPSVARYRDSIVFSRIEAALDRLRKTQSTKAIEDYFTNRSSLDESRLETSYAGVRYFVWLIPTLGFLGTVLGIGMAINSFGEIIQSSKGVEQVKAALPIVTSSLGTAFDTTLLALVLNAIAVFYMSFLVKRQEQLLEAIDHLCFDDVCSLFEEYSAESRELVSAITKFVDDIQNNSNGNRAAIERVIEDKLPLVLVRHLSRDIVPMMASAIVQEIRDSVLPQLIPLFEQSPARDAAKQVSGSSRTPNPTPAPTKLAASSKDPAETMTTSPAVVREGSVPAAAAGVISRVRSPRSGIPE
jgi:biopolymer transport protein ExbB/TolQ